MRAARDTSVDLGRLGERRRSTGYEEHSDYSNECKPQAETERFAPFAAHAVIVFRLRDGNQLFSLRFYG